MFINPYQEILPGQAPLKTNFHTHAGVCLAGACGRLPMDPVLDAYARAGYGALAISNHNEYRDPPAGNWEDMALVDAVEYSHHPHMLLIGTRRFQDIPHQEAIDSMPPDGLAVLCHPHWPREDYLPAAFAKELHGYVGLEIMNPVIYRLQGSGLATDLWDELLTWGRLCYGFGNDDFHEWEDLGRGFNLIFSRSSAWSDIREAICAGRFCASTGMELVRCQLEGKLLTVQAKYRNGLQGHPLRYRAIGAGGQLLAETIGDTLVFPLQGDMPYVRVEAEGEHGARLWLQPVYQEDALRPGWVNPLKGIPKRRQL